MSENTVSFENSIPAMHYCGAVLIGRIKVRPSVCPTRIYRLLIRKQWSVDKKQNGC